MSSYARVGVVTGANKGIGYAIVRQLALQYPQSPSNSGSLLVYLTARDESRGEAALQSLVNDNQLKDARALSSDGGLSSIKFHALDIADSESITAFKHFLGKEHPDGIDFVINNAAIAMDGFDENVVRTTLRCNYYGALEATEAYLPLLKPDGRMVNVASSSGTLTGPYTPGYAPAIAQRFRDVADARDVSEVTALMEEFANAVARGSHAAEGWPSAAYHVSKAGEIAATKVIATRERTTTAAGGRRELLINSCCPGAVITDMSKQRGVKTPDEGAQTPVMLAISDIGDRTGLFWRDEEVIDW